MTNEEIMFENRTELELKAIQFMRDVLQEPFDEDDFDDERHLLQEFYDGYSRKIDGKYVYNFDDSSEMSERIEKFIKIVGADIDGQYLYNAKDHEIVFGLIKELGL